MALRGEEPDISAAKRVARSRAPDDRRLGARVGRRVGGARSTARTGAALRPNRRRRSVRPYGRSSRSSWCRSWPSRAIGPFAAIKRSAALFRQRWGQQVTGNLVIGGVSGLIAVVGVVIGVGGVVPVRRRRHQRRAGPRRLAHPRGSDRRNWPVPCSVAPHAACSAWPCTATSPTTAPFGPFTTADLNAAVRTQ